MGSPGSPVSPEVHSARKTGSAEGVCPACGKNSARHFYSISGVPIHSVLLFGTSEEALSYPRADVALAFCQECGYIWNTAYTGEHIEYSDRYEETQGYSAAFQEFHRSLAERLIDRFALRHKTILEIGCGKRGEFLHLLCDLGENRGLGFDPVYAPERDALADRSNTTFYRELYTKSHPHTGADFVCCKMTMEHIAEPYPFVQMARAATGGNPDAVVFVQVPEMNGILERNAFWDVYYEHCSYFTHPSLAHVFERAGCRILDIWNDYDGQLLMIAAAPDGNARPATRADEVASLGQRVVRFEREVEENLARWRRAIASWAEAGKRIVIWGAGSKGVAFLTKTSIEGAIPYAVDINPKKWETFMAGTAQRIVSPEFLRQYRPDKVIVMNPYYIPEIDLMLRALDLRPALYSIERPEEPVTHESGGGQ